MNQDQLIVRKLKIVSLLADSLALGTDSRTLRKGLRLIADETFDAAIEIASLQPDAEEPLRQILARYAN